MNRIKNWIKIISVLIGTMIGAGFASGKEIFVFFAKYGIFGMAGAAISATLTAIILYRALKIVKCYNIKDNNEFIVAITKGKWSFIIKSIINMFLIISFWVMNAGFCSFFKQEMGVPIIVTAVILEIIIYILFMKNIDGIIKANTVMVPVMIAIIVVISLKNINIDNIPINMSQDVNILKILVSATIYASYNSITLIPIVISLNKCVENEREGKIITAISGLIIFILIVCIFKILNTTRIDIANIEIPILSILTTYSKNEKILYSVAIVSAIFTSAITSGYAALENLKDSKKYRLASLVICLMAIPISYMGFGNLVEILYPLFGVIGISQIILLFVTKVEKQQDNKLNNAM